MTEVQLALASGDGVETLRLKVDGGEVESRASRKAIAQAAEILRSGGTVAFPTETVYGLGANALDEMAVAKIFAAKERPGWDPLIVHVGEQATLGRVAAEVNESARRLIDAFWPGPLTLLLPRSAEIPERVTAGLPRVGVRMPAHPVAHALLVKAGIPVAAPSANRFGRISPTNAYDVAEDLEGRIDAILDGGETTHGVESTVVEARAEGCLIYRPGVVTWEQIGEVCGGEVTLRGAMREDEAREAAPAPGMGVRHYAPQARVVLVEGGWLVGSDLCVMEEVNRLEEAGEVVGVMGVEGFMAALPLLRKKGFDLRGFTMGYNTVHVYHWGSWKQPEELARKLYPGLRWLDKAGVTAIVCPLPEPVGIGLAIRDRLEKAAG
jgi:L-threonylcarbamoyladenylate synthase